MLSSSGQTVDVPRLQFVSAPVFDRRGYYRSPVTLPQYRTGKRPANAGRKFPPEVLTPAEVYALIDACGRGPAGRRNRALITMMWRAGLRCSEALALYPKDIDFDQGVVQVLHGKGDKRRVVALDAGAAAICERWTRERVELELTGRHPYFCVISHPTRGMPLGDAYVRELFKRLAVKAGIEKRVHPHGLRHTYAAFLIEQPQVNVVDVQTMLGHSSLNVTARYINHLNPSERLRKVRSIDWPSPKAVAFESKSARSSFVDSAGGAGPTSSAAEGGGTE